FYSPFLPLSLHDALPIFFLVRRAIAIRGFSGSLAAVQTAAKTAIVQSRSSRRTARAGADASLARQDRPAAFARLRRAFDSPAERDRKSTRLNSSHQIISY